MALADAEARPNTARTLRLPLHLSHSIELSEDDLDRTNELYDAHLDEWLFLGAAYDGIRELVTQEAIKQHERESLQNFKRRMSELFGFGYTKSIVDLFTFYLFKREPKRDYKALGDQQDFKDFLDDCDLEGNEYGNFLVEQARYASIYGYVGILIDKPNSPSASPQTRAEALRAGVYPYVAAYLPPAILDWQFQRDDFSRPYLAFLKLKDDDGMYRLWWPEKWEVWRKADAESEDAGERMVAKKGGAVLVAEGDNPLGVVPFVWLYNLKGKHKPIGLSDVHDIARIDLSITRNLSQCEEVVNYAAFPMLMEPSIAEEDIEKQDEVGPTAVKEFDPDNPEGTKPEWLEAKVEGPVRAMLELIQRKVSEIYRASNAGGMASMEISSVAKSGAALSAEFQLLNSKLVQKAVNIEKAERGILWCWCMWQQLEHMYEEVLVEYSRTYDVENLAQDLENTLTAQAIVHSVEFRRAMEKSVVRLMLPAATEDLLGRIDTEIEQADEFIIRPRRAVEIVSSEEEALDLERKQVEVDKGEAEIERTKAEDVAQEMQGPPGQPNDEEEEEEEEE